MPYLIDGVYLAALALAFPWLVYKVLSAGKHRRGFWRKLSGRAFHRGRNAPCVWFHGVSVGEIHLLRPLVRCFRERHPEWDCVISATTETGHAEARRRFPDVPVFYWPFDFSWAVRRALRRINPSLVVLAESELWPNFLAACRRRGTPVALVNGRISPRTFRRLRRLPSLGRRLVRELDLILAQTQEYAEWFRALGADPARIEVTGSVKYDGVQADRLNPDTLRLRHLLGFRKGDLIWLAGSTQDPEEEFVVSIYRRLRTSHPRLRLVLVPRQKERFDAVAHLLRCAGIPFIRRTAVNGPVTDPDPVILVDTIGELGFLWGLADIAFVGGSLDGRRGGQNMIEPAAYGAAVLFGPHVWNFRETARRMVAAGAAIQVENRADLESAVGRLLDDPVLRARLGEGARTLVFSQQGAATRTVLCLERLLDPARARGRAA